MFREFLFFALQLLTGSSLILNKYWTILDKNLHSIMVSIGSAIIMIAFAHFLQYLTMRIFSVSKKDNKKVTKHKWQYYFNQLFAYCIMTILLTCSLIFMGNLAFILITIGLVMMFLLTLFFSSFYERRF